MTLHCVMEMNILFLQQEIDDLEQQVFAKKKTIEEKRAFLQNESEVQAQLRKDIEVVKRME